MHLVGGYPEEIAHYDASEFGLMLNNVVWDIQRGNILKLAEGKLIVRGYHGRKPLTVAQMEEQYGSPPKFTALDYPTVIRRLE